MKQVVGCSLLALVRAAHLIRHSSSNAAPKHELPVSETGNQARSELGLNTTILLLALLVIMKDLEITYQL